MRAERALALLRALGAGRGHDVVVRRDLLAARALLVIGGLDLVNDRSELDPVVQSLLHESADSYTAQRISYIQNMRARLAGGTDVNQLEDVYADY